MYNIKYLPRLSAILTYFNYLQLLYREVKGILLHQGIPRLILSTKHPESNEECFQDKIRIQNSYG